jgi:Icc-related predicted phosphoesterase
MLICFTSDLHGHATLYDQLDALLRDQRPDLLILGGDLFIDGEGDDAAATQIRYVETTFTRRLAGWKSALPRLEVACIAGNHDWLPTLAALSALQRAGRMVMLDPHRPWTHRGVNFTGYWLTPPTPFWVKDFERLDLPGDAAPAGDGAIWDALQARIRALRPGEHFVDHTSLSRDLAGLGPGPAPWCFVCHCPPHDTLLDRLPHVPVPVGSRAVRRFIERHHPALALHGHIHESPLLTGGCCDIVGHTPCINPGQGLDRLQAVLFESDRPRETLRHTVLT